MKIAFEGTGTASDLADKTMDAQDAAEGEASTVEKSAVAAAFEALAGILSAAPGDGQATAKMAGEIRGTELVNVYLEITVVPSAAIQEAKAAASAPAQADDYEPAATIGDSDE